MKIEMIPIEQLHAHPNNPRKDLGDLGELTESIRANGIMQNLTVVRGHYLDADELREYSRRLLLNLDDCELKSAIETCFVESDYTIIIGHRRAAAAKIAGLEALPCVVDVMTEKEQISVMLLENMQRSDLSIYEQAQGFQLMMDLGSTVDEIAEKTGFSATTVRRRVKLMELDQKMLKEVSSRQISIMDFDKLNAIEDIKERNRILATIGTNNFEFETSRAIALQEDQRKLTIIRKALFDAGVERLSDGERFNGEFQTLAAGDFNICLRSWKKGDPIVPPCNGKMYYVEMVNGINFYTDQEKSEKKTVQSAEDIRRRQEMAMANEEAADIDRVLSAMRCNFLDNVTFSTENLVAVQKAVAVGFAASCAMYESVRDSMIRALKLDPTAPGMKTTGDVGCRVATELTQANFQTLKEVAKAVFGETTRRATYVKPHHGQAKEWPEHQSNVRLDIWYDLLEGMGYTMSDDEKKMRDGTHDVFKKPQ